MSGGTPENFLGRTAAGENEKRNENVHSIAERACSQRSCPLGRYVLYSKVSIHEAPAALHDMAFTGGTLGVAHISGGEGEARIKLTHGRLIVGRVETSTQRRGLWPRLIHHHQAVVTIKTQTQIQTQINTGLGVGRGAAAAPASVLTLLAVAERNGVLPPRNVFQQPLVLGRRRLSPIL